MKPASTTVAILLSCGLMFLFSCQMKQSKHLVYPVTAKCDTVDTYFGTKVSDPYRWLEDDQSEQTKNWVKAQNQVTQDYLSKIPYREQIHQRLSAIWNFERMTSPFKEGGRYFFSKNDGLQNQNVFYVQDKLTDMPKMILDPNSFSDKGTVALSAFSVSRDGKYLGYGLSKGGSDWNELYVKDIDSDSVLADHIQWVKFSTIAWFGKGFFYSRYPEPKAGDQLKGENKNSKVYYHQLGDDQSKDQLIYEDREHPEWGFSVEVTDDEQYLVISVTESTSGNAVYIKSLRSDSSPVVKLVEGFDNDFMFAEHLNGQFYFLTNNDAARYKLVAIADNKLGGAQFTDVIPQDATDVLTQVSFVGNRLIANYMKDARSLVKIYQPDGTYLHDLQLPGIGTAAGFIGSTKDDVTFYSFSSFNYPSVIYKYDATQNQSAVYYQTKIDFDLSDYETEQLFFPSKDGTKVPVFVVHKKGLKLDGSHPLWLYGYGGFNISLNPAFDIRRLVWLENGGVYAVVNLRGGGEYGEEWHLAGTKMHKQNVFDDFIGAAQFLIEKGYTSPKRIVAQGGSNGGLLIGATVNQAPELFGVAFPQVGVMDMLRYHQFTIGRYWATDYGTSEESKEMFDYLLAYSPVHNVKPMNTFPAIMVTTADHDDRVVPAHSFKYIAALQEGAQTDIPRLIRIDTDAGHGAGKPTSKLIDEWADLYVFAFYNLSIEPSFK